MPAPTASLFKARPRRPWRSIAWIGGALVTGFTTYAAYDLDQSYRAAVAETGRELDAQARVIAEQTTRSMQSVDLVLRHLTTSHRGLASASHSRSNMHAYLQDQAIGMVQVESLAIFDANGALVANSMLADPPPLHIDVVNDPAFSSLRQVRGPQLSIAAARPALFKPQAWVFPIARRLETPGGAFGGIVYAGGRVEYFEQFYRDLRLGEGTAVTLMHRDGTLLARHPSAPTSLGQRYPAIDGLLTAGPGSAAGPHRAVSPIDGVDRFGVVEITPDYPLAVIVTRDATVALAAWREQAIGTMTHTVVLGLLSVLLLVLVTRQFTRLDQARESLEHSRERFALAAAGSDEGIWDWDVGRDRIYASARARAIFGLPPGPDVQPREEWFASVSMHPDDVEVRRAALQAHLAGESPVYAGEYRVRHPDGEFRWIRVRGLCVRDAQGTPVRMAGSVTDIDARKRAEEALRLSEQRFSLAVAGSSDGIVDWDIVNDRMFTSQRTMEMLGIDSRQTERTRAEWMALLRLHPDDRQRHADELCEFLASDKVLREGEYRLQRNDGEYAWIRLRNLCVRDAQGRPLRLAGSVSDIDAYKRVEAALRKSDERYALAVAGSDDGVWDWDLAAGVAFESARARELQGLPPGPEEMPLDQLVDSLRVHPEDAPLRAEGIRAHLAGETPAYECEYRVRHDDVGYRWIRVRALCIRDGHGKPCRIAGSVSDIDARKCAEEGLRRSEERYQLAVAGSNEGVWDWDLANDSVFMSARAQELLRLPPGELQRPRREWLALGRLHPEDDARVRTALTAHLQGQSKHFKVEYRVLHGDGLWHWYRQRGVAVRDAAGRPTRMAGSIEDISERKRSEDERGQLETQLRQAQKLEAIGTLAGGIAHDFNNILAAILGYGEMALKDAAEGSAQRRHIDAAMSAGMRAKSLVERILAFSRSGMGDRVPVHVQSVVAEALDGVAASLPAGIVLERSLECGDASVMGDPTQVHQVVMNLCANAAQSMKSGGTLTVTLAEAHLSGPRCLTSVLPDGHYITLSVRDSGSGIAPELLDRIFDPFFTTKEVGVGTGLGLSLVHGIVTDLGGGICVDSRIGEGSNFKVYLPWQGEVTAPIPLEEASVPSGNGETVLLVDDEEPLVRLGEEMIAQLGYEPVGFTSSVAALATFRAEPQRFSLVLSDEAMPEMTGSELVQEIRRIRPDIPIVLMSGYVTTALATRARDAGVVEVLSKPLVSRDIARSLASALQR